MGNPYLCFIDSHWTAVWGTSAATPVFSAVVAKLNSLRLAKGGQPLGFLNPWLYQNADALNDVTLHFCGFYGTCAALPLLWSRAHPGHFWNPVRRVAGRNRGSSLI